MNYKTIFTSGFFLKSIFIASLLILIFISAISYRHTTALTESSELVVHSFKIHIELDHLFSYIKEAESGQHSFILSSDSVFLKEFDTARLKVSKSLIEMIKYSRGKPTQQNKLDTLNDLINTRFALLINSLKLSIEQPSNKYLLDINMLKGHDVMERIRVHINNMIEHEKIYISEKQKKNKHEMYFTPFFNFLLLIFSSMIFIFSYYKINKDLETFKASNESLLLTTESIKHAEVIGDFSTWNYNLELNKLIFSDNLYRLLGCEPQSFEASFKSLEQFVHPDDKIIFLKSTLTPENEEKPLIIYYRILKQNGELRYFKSLSKLLNDIESQKFVIGILWDVTEQQLSSVALNERNLELEQSNKELASFNHIASHDLQEPLRKIQIFISRILEEKEQGKSEFNLDYFSRIQAAVGRMRILIDDLLLFSRANKMEKIFELTDLNILLENAKLELAQVIEEKKAMITSETLPEISVIPFQIKQLFINLLSNSIKYSRSGVNPVIHIKCSENYGDLPLENDLDTKKKYYKISIEDNGMGFDQKYAENIFTLFFRLHQMNEFEGTGIGLSICKKILDNHKGFIKAQGIKDQGAIFKIYLPT